METYDGRSRQVGDRLKFLIYEGALNSSKGLIMQKINCFKLFWPPLKPDDDPQKAEAVSIIHVQTGRSAPLIGCTITIGYQFMDNWLDSEARLVFPGCKIRQTDYLFSNYSVNVSDC